ncbi:hypothetical protein L218DRAFT_950883 [Marasmius fiardii PR-910]|nr:hypothetical protein L218DRAFT_950883 [Marasmius fiardii PR-910]
MPHPGTGREEYSVPLELVNKIIGFASYNWKTLLSLTLICRSWLPLVYAHLFDRIKSQLQPHHERERRLGSKKLSAEEEVEYIANGVNGIRDRKWGNIVTSLCIGYYDRPDFAPYQGLLKSLPSLCSFESIVELKYGQQRNSLNRDVSLHIGATEEMITLTNVYHCNHRQAQFPNCLFLESGRWICLAMTLQHPYHNVCGFVMTIISDNSGYGAERDLSPFEVLESVTFVSSSSEHHFETIRLLLETVSSSHFRTFSMVDMSIGLGKPRGPRHSVEGRLRNLDVILATEKFSRVTVEVHFSVTTEAFPFYEQTAKRCSEKSLKQGRFLVLMWKHRARRKSWSDWGTCENGMKLDDWKYY